MIYVVGRAAMITAVDSSVLIPDFLIAAHAQVDCDRLAAADRGYLRRYLPKVIPFDDLTFCLWPEQGFNPFRRSCVAAVEILGGRVIQCLFAHA